jgi:hypothetical protein
MVVVVTDIVYIIIMDLQYSPTSYAHLYYIEHEGICVSKKKTNPNSVHKTQSDVKKFTDFISTELKDKDLWNK